MMKKIRFILVLLMVLLKANLQGQDPQFSQFYSNPLYLAPSFAGLVEDSRITLNYRNQWPEIPGAYNTYAFSFDHFFDAFNSGLGLFVMKDIAGSGNLSTTNLGVQYSYDFKITNTWHMRPGVHFFYTERGIDFQKLVWHDQMSATGNAPSSAEVVPLEKISALDFSTSLLAYSSDYWIGFSVDHLLQPNQSLYYIESGKYSEGYIPIKYSFFGGTKIINKGKLLRPMDTSLQFAFLFKKQDKFSQLDLGAYFYTKPIVVGLWYRGIPVIKPMFNQDAFTALLGIKFDNFSVGYSYDFTVSRLISYTGGAHELSLSYDFTMKIKPRKPHMVPCPDF